MDYCILCRSSEKDDITFGEFLTKFNISVHTYCLYLSSNLAQNGADEEGIFGFLPNDIKNEESRIKKLNCCYCHKSYANIGCCQRKCRRCFHFSCGLKNGCENQFISTHQSFCNRHRKKVNYRATKKDICCICFDPMIKPGQRFDSIKMIRAPCCKNGFFHKRCLQEFAVSSGYFFKCPLCNDKEKFRKGVQYRGIYIPNRDAVWELEPNAFSELYQRPNRCSAIKCINPDGRDTESEGQSFLFCNICGSYAIHENCLTLEQGNKNSYKCAECLKILNEDSGRESINSSNPSDSVVASHIADEGDGEDEYIDVCGFDEECKSSINENIYNGTCLHGDSPFRSEKLKDNCLNYNHEMSLHNNCLHIDNCAYASDLNVIEKSENLIDVPDEELSNHIFNKIIRKKTQRKNRIYSSESEASIGLEEDEDDDDDDDPLNNFKVFLNALKNENKFKSENENKTVGSGDLNVSCIASRTRRKSVVQSSNSTSGSDSRRTTIGGEFNKLMDCTQKLKTPRRKENASSAVRSRINYDVVDLTDSSEDELLTISKSKIRICTPFPKERTLQHIKRNFSNITREEESAKSDISCIALRTRRKSCGRILGNKSCQKRKRNKSDEVLAENSEIRLSRMSESSEEESEGLEILCSGETDAGSKNKLDISCIAKRTRRRKIQTITAIPEFSRHILSNITQTSKDKSGNLRSLPRVRLPKISTDRWCQKYNR